LDTPPYFIFSIKYSHALFGFFDFDSLSISKPTGYISLLQGRGAIRFASPAAEINPIISRPSILFGVSNLFIYLASHFYHAGRHTKCDRPFGDVFGYHTTCPHTFDSSGCCLIGLSGATPWL
jgi:hypothetical protein